MLHPVELPLQCFCWQFDSGSSNTQKQSVSNAFQYVVLRLVAPSPSDDILAQRADAGAKLRNLLGIKAKNRKNLKLLRNYLENKGIMPTFATRK